jgi:catechol 2,3-dioxygenase-like lactoylglutathione lyase family enzyme
MIDHISLPVTDMARALEFYRAALAPLGYDLVLHVTRTEVPALETAEVAVLGVGGRPDFGLRPADGPVQPGHVAFRVPTWALVDAFHAAALAAGGRDHGSPGPRPEYRLPNYYGAFVLDPDGHNIEAVCHDG